MPYVHEGGTFSTIISALQDFRELKDFNKSRNDRGVGTQYASLQRSSIMRASKDLVMSFPVLCSNTLTPSTASMISKAVERNCVTTLQLLFSSAYLKGHSGQEVIKRWHNNIDNDMSMDEYMDLIDTVSQTFESGLLAEAANYESEMVESCIHNTKRYPLSSFSERSIGSFSVREGYNGYTVRQSINEVDIIGPDGRRVGSVGGFYDPANSQTIDKDQWDANMRYAEYQQRNAQMAAQQQQNINRNNYTSARDKKADDFNQAKFDYEKKRNAARDQHEIDKFNHTQSMDYKNYALDVERNQRGKLVDQQGYFTKMLMDNDVKKCNELVPSMIIVQFQATDPSNPDIVFPQQFIAGVKARLIPCDSFEIMDRIRSIEKNKISMINLVRATTKEISFSRDFVAGIEQAKIEAKQNSKLSRTSPIWRSLQARATKSGINRLKKANKANDAGAITTLVVSQEEVNFLKKEYNIDINIPSKAKFVMESYNLMGLVIVDESVEVARFLFDGEKYFQDYSFGSLERETGDSSYKKVINLMSKINRG